MLFPLLFRVEWEREGNMDVRETHQLRASPIAALDSEWNLDTSEGGANALTTESSRLGSGCGWVPPSMLAEVTLTIASVS